MTVLVTGANGFLGASVVGRLLHHGERHVRCTVRPGRTTQHLAALAERFPDATVEVTVGDLRSREFARDAVSGVDAVYHVAAGMRGSAADLCQNTVVSSKNLLEGVVGGGLPRVVLVSSFSVYGAGELPRGSVIDESTPLETHPERRDLYSFFKIRQERLFWEYRDKHGFPLMVARPGVVYGPGGVALSSRVGIQIFGLFFNFGRGNTLPLTYLENCAEAVVVAGGQNDGDVFNVVDDDLPSASEFLRLYRRRVEKIRYLSMPYFLTMQLSRMVAWYNRASRGQLPAILTPYKTANHWRGHEFDNGKLKRAGWEQVVSTAEGLEKFARYWRESKNENGHGRES